MSLHQFDPEIAKKVGVNAAILYQNIVFWTKHNMANGKHFHDGMWWTYNSRRAFASQFEYLSEKQIRLCLEKLVDAGLVARGNFNKEGYDNTSWWSPTCSSDWKTTLAQKGQGLAQKGQGLAQKGQPIPDSKPDTKPDDSPKPPEGAGDDLFSETGQAPEEAPKPEDRFPEFYEAYPRKAARGQAEKAWAKAVKTTLPQTIIDGARRYAALCRQKGTEAQYIAHPATWLNGQRWADEDLRGVRLPEEITPQDRAAKFRPPSWQTVIS